MRKAILERPALGNEEKIELGCRKASTSRRRFKIDMTIVK